MKGRLKRRIKEVLMLLVVIYLAGGVVLYFVQSRILFHPKPLPRNHHFQFRQGFEETNSVLGKDNVSIVKFKTGNLHKGIVLFFHGNMENVEHYDMYPEIFLRNNYEVWMIDYPGFGKTSGELTEKNIDEQAMLMYDLASKEMSSDRIIIYGKSIGTGVASFVASSRNCRRLILETPYYSIPSLAKNYFPLYPVNWMIRYLFPINNYLKNVESTVTIFHGTRDEVIPYKNSTRLKEENQEIELIAIENGKHNNLSAYALFQKKMDSLLVK